MLNVQCTVSVYSVRPHSVSTHLHRTDVPAMQKRFYFRSDISSMFLPFSFFLSIFSSTHFCIYACTMHNIFHIYARSIHRTIKGWGTINCAKSFFNNIVSFWQKSLLLVLCVVVRVVFRILI